MFIEGKQVTILCWISLCNLGPGSLLLYLGIIYFWLQGLVVFAWKIPKSLYMHVKMHCLQVIHSELYIHLHTSTNDQIHRSRTLCRLLEAVTVSGTRLFEIACYSFLTQKSRWWVGYFDVMYLAQKRGRDTSFGFPCLVSKWLL